MFEFNREKLEEVYFNFLFPDPFSTEVGDGFILFPQNDIPLFVYGKEGEFFLTPFILQSFENKKIFNKGRNISRKELSTVFQLHIESLSEYELYKDISQNEWRIQMLSELKFLNSSLSMIEHVKEYNFYLNKSEKYPNKHYEHYELTNIENK